ncbi:MAG TPA: hypothetical protein VGF30_14105 [Bacteroidia bacterium]
MTIKDLLADKSIKPKEKTETLSQLISSKEISLGSLVTYTTLAKDAEKATCIEALEFATKSNPKIIDKNTFDFVVSALGEKAPRVKWESAKVIGNTAHLFSSKLDEAIPALIKNTEHTGTVVRWAAAFALGEIVKLNTKENKQLVPAIDAIILREEKNSIKKIYQEALKKIA